MSKRLKIAVIDGEVFLVNRAGRPELQIVSMTVEPVEKERATVPPSLGGAGGSSSSIPSTASHGEEQKDGVRGNQIDPALIVWRTYHEVMKPRSGSPDVLPAQERSVIKEALKVATVEECSTAIRGCFASDFHMHRGRYAGKKGRRYNRLSDILRGKQGKRTTRESIDLFIEYTAKSGVQSSVTSVDAAKLRQAKQAIRDHAEFPGDENVADRGRRAEAWLIQQGWTVSREGEQITFVPPSDLSA